MLYVPKVIITYKPYWGFEKKPEIIRKVEDCFNSIGIRKEIADFKKEQKKYSLKMLYTFPLHHYLSFTRAIKLVRALDKSFNVMNFHYDADFNKLDGDLAVHITIYEKY